MVGILQGVTTIPPNLSATSAKLQEEIKKFRDNFQAHTISNKMCK
jgi:hypothetical protein